MGKVVCVPSLPCAFGICYSRRTCQQRTSLGWTMPLSCVRCEVYWVREQRLVDTDIRSEAFLSGI